MNTRRIAILVGLLLFILVGFTAEAQITPRMPEAKQVFQLCAALNCFAAPLPPPPKPNIEVVKGTFIPGAEVFVGGSGFGNAVSTFDLVPSVSGNPVIHLTKPDWHDTYIFARIPDVSGVPDQSMNLYVSTQGGDSNRVPVSFTAAREVVALRPEKAQVVNCDNYATEVNGCNLSFDPYVANSVHWEDSVGHVGTDVYSASVTNGWRFDHMSFLVMARHVIAFPFGIDWAVAKGFTAGSPSATVAVEWGTSFKGEISYGVTLYIIGPKGVPYK